MGYVPTSALRCEFGHEREAMRRFPPLAADHPLVVELAECAICGEEFLAGATTTAVPLGPGKSTERITGGYYSCVAVIAHADCAGLYKDREPSEPRA